MYHSPATTNWLRQFSFIALTFATISLVACGTPGSTLATPNHLAVRPAPSVISATSTSEASTSATFTSATSTSSTSATSSSDSATAAASYATPSAPRVLLYIGAGTSSGDVAAVEARLSALKLAYATANTSQLNSMSETQLKSYRLFIVPGGNSITIGRHLSDSATTKIRDAVSNDGLHYLGVCAGGFFGGYSMYNAVDFTSGVWFNFYADEFKGIHKAAVEVSFSGSPKLDIYWQDGPQLSGWGHVVGKYPDGTPAIVENSYGKGFVILSGVHPEAPAGWRTGMKFSTPVAVDLAFADTLIEAALNGTWLKHF